MKKLSMTYKNGIFALAVLTVGFGALRYFKMSSVRAPIASEINAAAKFEEYFSLVQPHLSLFSQAMAADETGDSTCNKIGMTAWSSCFTKNSAYQHGALNFFNNMLCTLNKGFPSAAETSLCHFNKSMGMNPDKAALPVTVSKTFGDKTIVLTVAKPTETFATAAGYDAKGTVTVNGSNFMILYWGGTETSSKGFLISGAAGMGMSSQKNPMYIQWDRTDSTAQSVKVFVTNFTTSYLTTFSSMSQSNPQGGDRAMFGTATYNASTKAVTAQVVSIEGQRGSSSTSAGCFKMFGTGTKEGSISVAKTKDALGQTGHATNDANKDGTDMDAAVLTDSASTANGTGNYSSTTAAGMTVSFTKSCNDVLTASGTGKPFASNDVSFTASPADIF